MKTYRVTFKNASEKTVTAEEFTAERDEIRFYVQSELKSFFNNVSSVEDITPEKSEPDLSIVDTHGTVTLAPQTTDPPPIQTS